MCRAAWAVVLGLLLLVADGVEGHGGGAHKPKGEKTPTAQSKLPPEPEKYKLFEQVEDGVRRAIHRMLHTVTTKHPLKLMLEVQILLLGFDSSGAGGYGCLIPSRAHPLPTRHHIVATDARTGGRRVKLDEVQLSTFLSKAYRKHQPYCMVRGPWHASVGTPRSPAG